MSLGDVEPAHPGIADRIGDLQGSHACEISGEAVDHEVDLHARRARHVIVLVADIGLKAGDGMALALPAARAQVLFHLSHKGSVLVEKAAILDAYRTGNAIEFLFKVIED